MVRLPSRRPWWKAVCLIGCGGVAFQATGCGVDPDLLLQAGIQFFAEVAIFATDNLLSGL